jgi:hypothetical protein
MKNKSFLTRVNGGKKTLEIDSAASSRGEGKCTKSFAFLRLRLTQHGQFLTLAIFFIF